MHGQPSWSTPFFEVFERPATQSPSSASSASLITFGSSNARETKDHSGSANHLLDRTGISHLLNTATGHQDGLYRLLPRKDHEDIQTWLVSKYLQKLKNNDFCYFDSSLIVKTPKVPVLLGSSKDVDGDTDVDDEEEIDSDADDEANYVEVMNDEKLFLLVIDKNEEDDQEDCQQHYAVDNRGPLGHSKFPIAYTI
ncbi:hypothetical protein M3Y98_00549700 [Aphelenchoides besseyi]|nr:hypothetical protein M3Y98_00549700 [Aphelenchoides besseyi]